MTMKCPVCRTAKKVVGLGGIIKDCSRCNAKGYIDEAVDLDKELAEVNKIIAFRKKPGPKPKNNKNVVM